MKSMRKLFALALAVIMVMAMATTAFAEGETSEPTEDTSNATEPEVVKGSIEIDNAIIDQTYTVYQILDLESYDASSGAYAYKATDGWADWLATQTAYVSIDDQGYVSWVQGADVAVFAAAAQKYAEDNNLANQGSKTADSATVEFTGLDLGYYLLDSTVGTLCSLDTTNPTVTISEKNEVPTITKEVLEDSNSEWGATNDDDLGKTVYYQATITVQKGAENYIMHDIMSSGLTYGSVTSVTVGGTDVDAANYTVISGTHTTECEEDCDKHVDDGCTFEVVFSNDYISTLADGTEIVVAYTATINENAIIGLPGNPNEVKLEYGDEKFTPESTTVTYVWDMEVLKYANGNEATVLEGAKFVLLNSAKTQVANIVSGKFVGWVNIETTTDLTAYALTTDASGKIEIDGLDADTYYLRETEAPAGYNKLSGDVEVKVVAASADTNDSDEDGNTTELVYATAVAKVNNQSGTELPDTGGIGTTLFYIVGGVLVAGAVILLITKRRMNMAE